MKWKILLRWLKLWEKQKRIVIFYLWIAVLFIIKGVNMKTEDIAKLQQQKEALDEVEQIIKQWVIKRRWQEDLDHYEDLRKQFMYG
jgi:CRISPR/Cas system CMR-associated protein Cmr5 small subunit